MGAREATDSKEASSSESWVEATGGLGVAAGGVGASLGGGLVGLWEGATILILWMLIVLSLLSVEPEGWERA